MRLTSCFVHIQWLRKRCMANSVARRPHTATSVRGLISPPSPSLVVCLLFTVFLSSPPHTFAYSLQSDITFHQSVSSFLPNHIYCTFSPVDPSLTPHLLASTIFHHAPSCLFPTASISSPLWLCVRLKLLILLCLSACLFFAELYYCGWLERGDCCVAWSHWVNSWYWRVMESDNGKTQTKLKYI